MRRIRTKNILPSIIALAIVIKVGSTSHHFLTDINVESAEPIARLIQETGSLVEEQYVQTTPNVTDETGTLAPSQIELLQNYALRYQSTLLNMESADISDLYIEKDENYYINKTAFDTLCTIRSMSEKDLSLLFSSVEFTIVETTFGSNTIDLILKEDTVQQFSFMDSPSYTYNIYHEFTICEYNGKWYIESHTQWEDFYLLVEEAWGNYYGDAESISKNVLDAIIYDTAENIEYANDTFYDAPSEKTAQVPYDAQSAIEYAEAWSNERNYTGNYLAYDDFGGNCQNFASQCLYAGGIPMDTSGYIEYQWKFYSETINSYQSPSGRSYSWTGVDPFFTYAEGNTGTGLVAQTDAGLSYVEEGDVIQLGAMADWRHSVFVTDVVRDERGNIENIIIASNTADRLNYPLAAYVYTAPRLIHIIGYNN